MAAAPARNAVIAGTLFVALFIGSIAIVLVANLEFGDNEVKELAWWKKTLIYHIYVPSFKDSNGDGMGDLKGKQPKIFLNDIYRTTYNRKLMAEFVTIKVCDKW